MTPIIFVLIACCDIKFFEKFKVRTHGWMKIKFQDTFMNYVFRFFEPIRARLASKLQKWQYDPKNIFPQYVYQKMQNWVRFRIRWQKAKKFTRRKIRGLRTFVHSTLRWKGTLFFLYRGTEFLHFLNGLRSASNSAYFWYPYQRLWIKYFWGHISTFCQLRT